MSSSVQHRLQSWRKLVAEGGPKWLLEHAPRIIRELEAEMEASRLNAMRPE